MKKNNKLTNHQKGAIGEGLVNSIFSMMQIIQPGKIECIRPNTTLEHDNGVDLKVKHSDDFDLKSCLDDLLK